MSKHLKNLILIRQQLIYCRREIKLLRPVVNLSRLKKIIKKSGPLYFSSQILKLTQSSGVRIHISTAMSVEMYMIFFPLKLVDKVQANEFQMLTSAFFTDIFVLPTMAVSVPTLELGTEQTRDVRCSNTNSKERIVSHLQTCPLVRKQEPLRWCTVSDHYEETTVRIKDAYFVQRHKERKEGKL